MWFLFLLELWFSKRPFEDFVNFEMRTNNVITCRLHGTVFCTLNFHVSHSLVSTHRRARKALQECCSRGENVLLCVTAIFLSKLFPEVALMLPRYGLAPLPSLPYLSGNRSQIGSREDIMSRVSSRLSQASTESRLEIDELESIIKEKCRTHFTEVQKKFKDNDPQGQGNVNRYVSATPTLVLVDLLEMRV